MQIFVTILIILNILLHCYFLILEMFLWEKPKGRKVFGTSETFAKESAGLAKNQGLYNGFLAAGLLWGILSPNAVTGHAFQVFFLACMTIAGVYGGFTVNKRILVIQALPAVIALALISLGI